MLDSAFLQACEAAAIAWDVPALATGLSIAGIDETAAFGCDASARFHVASITKPFTASLAVDLLELESPTGLWPADVRVRHLLSHTSGYDCELTNVSQALFETAADPLDAQLEALGRVRRWLPVEQCWSYANTGYWLAGSLAARAAGSSYEEALQARVLGPAGLEATSFEAPDVPGTGPDAATAPYPRARRPSGGLISNVPDLLRFGRRLLPERRLQIPLGKPAGGVYGLGLWGERVGGVEVWGHSGSWGGYQSSLLLVPDRDAVFVGLTNARRGGNALFELEEIFFTRLLGTGRRVAETVELSDSALEGFAGSYSNGDGWYDVSYAIGGLAVHYDDGEFLARPIGERTFEIFEGARMRERFDFPLEGFGRFGSRLAQRVAEP